uniref:Uncharacterized protein n=1 Tax=Arundo donax TaxID=35708 RepID=A0A0A9HC54_ARUDO
MAPHGIPAHAWELSSDEQLLPLSRSGCPLMLGLKDNVRGKRRFHFESFWPKFEWFMEVVTASWATRVNATCLLVRLSIKFKHFTKCLQSWSQKKVGHIKLQLQLAREILHRLEIAQDSRVLSKEESWLRHQLKHHCLGRAFLERTIARLRS